MIKYFFIAVCAFMITGCATSKNLRRNNGGVFASELNTLQRYFSIPGLAAIVEKDNEVVFESYNGYADIDRKIMLDSTIAFPVASLTKTFSATLVLKLVEEGLLNIDDPALRFVAKFPDSIKIKHLLSHTSQGEVGRHFYYSSRFSYLTSIIEKASGRSFETLMQDEIFSPLKMQRTFLLKDSAQLAATGIEIAQPYVLGDGIRPGEVEYGFSAAAGVVSTPRDMMRFYRALDNDKLISTSSRKMMMTPFGKGIPYGFGLFTQTFEGVDLVWAYGQYDAYSSLLIKVPSRGLTLLLMANNNLLSDPARLIMGDVGSSLFAISFLKNFVFDLSNVSVLGLEKELSIIGKYPSFYRKKKIAQALAASFLSVSDSNQLGRSIELLDDFFYSYPNYLEYADINLFHTLCFLKDVAFYFKMGELNQFDEAILKISDKLLRERPDDPYIHSYLGTYYDRKGQIEIAKQHFARIVSTPNFSENWYTKEAKAWLDDHK